RLEAIYTPTPPIQILRNLLPDSILLDFYFVQRAITEAFDIH
ncbi:9200_t:CDS:1, partial [Acaulospora morrowiae]